MGTISSSIFGSYIQIKNVAIINIHTDGFGELIASCNISKGVYLIDNVDPDDKKCDRLFSSYMNDIDFKYPFDYFEESIRSTFDLYNNSNNNNCKSINDQTLITICDIKQGDPLTKKCGLFKWSHWLIGDILNNNPYVNNNRVPSDFYGRYFHPQHSLNKENKLLAVKNVIKVAKEFGFAILLNSRDQKLLTNIT